MESEKWLIEQFNHLENKENFAFLVLNIKRFRIINRILGRSVGDELVKMLSEIILQWLDSGEFAAHTHADNFNLLVHYSSIEQISERIVSVCRVFSHMPDSRFDEQVFLGIGVFPLTAEFTDFYLAQYYADMCRLGSEQRFYHSSHFEIYGLSYQNPDEMYLDLQHEVLPAIRDGRFQLYLQPKVDLQTGKVTKAEALVRWIDPVRGMIPVIHFLPLMEDTGDIRKLDIYLFKLVCSNIEKWLKTYGKEIQISVNLSKCYFNDPDFFEDYRNVFQQFDIPKNCIEIELLESIILDQSERVKEVINALSNYGFHCSLDDFGSGFSSYSVLANSKISTLKIDRSLFRNQSDSREKIIVKHIIQTAHDLDMLTVAEGVESLEYVEYLRTINCDFIQGYVFYQPMPSDEFELRFVKGNESANLP